MQIRDTNRSITLVDIGNTEVVSFVLQRFSFGTASYNPGTYHPKIMSSKWCKNSRAACRVVQPVDGSFSCNFNIPILQLRLNDLYKGFYIPNTGHVFKRDSGSVYGGYMPHGEPVFHFFIILISIDSVLIASFGA